MQVSRMDRFIPQRRYTNMEVARHNISHSEIESISDISFSQCCNYSDSKQIFLNTAKYANNIINFRKLLSSAMGITHPKVLRCSMSEKKGVDNKKCSTKHSWPVVPRKKNLIGSPDVVLDMPDIDTTVHHHVIDWGKQGQIATIFRGEVHLWVSSRSQLAYTQTDKSVLECVRWNGRGTQFAVSRTRSRFSIIDAETFKIIRTVNCKCLDCTITAIEWSKSETVIAGCSYGSIICVAKNYPQNVYFYRILKHEIIDIKFSCNDSYLLTSTIMGSTAIFKWPITFSSMAPAMVFSSSGSNRCYIGSTSWHPWKESILAVGEIDNGITIWNVNNQKIMDYKIAKPYFKESCFLDCLTFNPLSAELLVSFYHESSDPESDVGLNFLTVFSDLDTRVDEMQFHIGRVPHALWDGTGTKLGTEIEEAHRIKSFSEALRSVAALEDFSQRKESESMTKKILELRTLIESSYVLNKNKNNSP